MKFEDYLKNRDPQFAESLNEAGWFGTGLNPEDQQYYDANKAGIDQIASGRKIPLTAAVQRYREEEPARMQMANMGRNQQLPPRDLRAAPQQGREGQLNRFNVPQRQRGTL
jgi:hypothetical protein